MDKKLTFGSVLKQQRGDSKGNDWYFTQPDIARELEISQGTVSNLENDIKSPDSLSAKGLLALLKAYRFSSSEILELTRRFDLALPASASHTDTLQSAQRFEVADTFIRFPVYQSVSAGELDADPIEGEVATIPLEDLKRAGADSRNVRVYLVNGDCMVAQSERGLVMSIVHGDKIGVDTSQRSGQRNEIVAAYWRPQDKLVIKRLIEDDNGGILLVPASPGHPKLVAESDDDFDIIGKVIWRGGPVIN